MVEFPHHPFWDFSLEVYMSEGVGTACIKLQSALALDVNVLLYCLWVAASRRGVITPDQLASLRESVKDWHQEVVRALRGVRTRMKEDFGSGHQDLVEQLRRRVQQTEIDCEHIEQLMLSVSLDLEVDDARPDDILLIDAVSNLETYFGTLGFISNTDRGNVAHILSAVFPKQAADVSALVSVRF